MKRAYADIRPLRIGMISRCASLAVIGILFLTSVQSASAAAVSLVTLSDETLALDPVGSGCLDYDPDDFDTPFNGKLASAPFCVPEPCERMLSRDRLETWIMGRAPEDWEWDAYASRYAEACVAETGTPWPGEVASDYPAVGPGDVYPSSRRGVFFQDRNRDQTRTAGSRRNGAGGGAGPGNSFPPRGGSPGGVIDIPCLDDMDPNAEDSCRPPEEGPSPGTGIPPSLPLPASVLLLLAGLSTLLLRQPARRFLSALTQAEP